MFWLGLLATVGGNYAVHRRRQKVCPGGCSHFRHATICAITRRYLPRPVADAVVAGVFAGLLGHIHNGYPPRILEETP